VIICRTGHDVSLSTTPPVHAIGVKLLDGDENPEYTDPKLASQLSMFPNS
jgi:hypothetical protein